MKSSLFSGAVFVHELVMEQTMLQSVPCTWDLGMPTPICQTTLERLHPKAPKPQSLVRPCSVATAGGSELGAPGHPHGWKREDSAPPHGRGHVVDHAVGGLG